LYGDKDKGEEGVTRIEEVIEGLQILAKYSNCIDAQHDVIYAGPGVASKVTAKDTIRLHQLGWHIDKEIDSWAKFT
jgi:hypothetical protein